MNFHFNTTGLDDFYRQLDKIGFLHKNTAHVHEFEVLKKFGSGYIRHYSYPDGLNISLADMTLKEGLTYSFAIQHRYLELLFVKSGYLEIYNACPRRLERVNAGEFMPFAAPLYQGWSGFPKNRQLQFLTITIDEQYLQALAAKGIDITAQIRFFRSRPAIDSPAKLSVDIEALVNKILLCPYDETLKKMFFEAVVLEILSEFLFRSALRENTPQLPALLNNADIEQLYLARQVLTERMAAPPSIGELSKLVCLNTYKLKQGFKALFADTIYGYLRRARMEKARLLLENTSLSIHDIALQLGYCNGSSLSPIFKAHYGITPKKYRQTK